MAIEGLGWPVFPIKPGSKIPLTRNGFKDASSDESVIAAWNKQWPDCNAGMVTGKASGIVVIDIDPRHGGTESLAGLVKQFGELPETPQSYTGGGGIHYLFEYPGEPVPCSTNRIAPGIDVKGDGGYIVVPPSIHESGKPYQWDIEMHPRRVALAPMPSWILDRIRASTHLRTVAVINDIPTGSRNSTLASLAGAMRRKGIAADEMYGSIAQINQNRCHPPLTDGEVRRIINSICAYTPADPIQARAKIVSVTADELSVMSIPKRDYLLEPWLRAKDLAMVYAKRGVGKTWIGQGIALAVAAESRFLHWNAPKARNVLLLDGEMQAEAIQARLHVLAETMGVPLPPTLTIIANDFQELGGLPNLANPEGQAVIEDFLDGMDLLIIDNISTLCRGGVENDAESWDIMQQWLLGLRRRGMTVILIHHAGNSGNQRGTSKREDVLDCSICLTRPQDYASDQGARFEVSFEKARALYGRSTETFEAWLREGEFGDRVWVLRTIEDAKTKRLKDLVADGLTLGEAAKECGVSKGYASKLLTKAREGR